MCLKTNSSWHPASNSNQTNSTHAEWGIPRYIDSTGAILEDECKGEVSFNFFILYLIVKADWPTLPMIVLLVWSCPPPPNVVGGTMDKMLATWPFETTITYDCGQAVIDQDPNKSTFTLKCDFNDGYKWISSDGYGQIPKCVLGE